MTNAELCAFCGFSTGAEDYSMLAVSCSEILELNYEDCYPCRSPRNALDALLISSGPCLR